MVKTGQEAEQNQSQWNTWLEKGDSEDHSRNLSNASAAAQEPQDRPKKAPSVLLSSWHMRLAWNTSITSVIGTQTCIQIDFKK